jgi:hypothetical protein
MPGSKLGPGWHSVTYTDCQQIDSVQQTWLNYIDKPYLALICYHTPPGATAILPPCPWRRVPDGAVRQPRRAGRESDIPAVAGFHAQRDVRTNEHRCALPLAGRPSACSTCPRAGGRPASRACAVRGRSSAGWQPAGGLASITVATRGQRHHPQRATLLTIPSPVQNDP